MNDHKLMPKHITEEMADAFWEEYSKSRTDDMLMRCYNAMYAVAPQSAEQREPVAAQHRFRHPQKSTPDWSIWQPAPISLDRPSWEIDTQGYEVEYRLLYDAPQSAEQWEPTDAELLAFAEEENFFLFCDEDEFLQIARAVMHRYMRKHTTLSMEPVGYVRPHHLEQLLSGKVCGITLEDTLDTHNQVTTPLFATPQPASPDEERLAMEAVMESVDPATWPGLTTAQRCALGRFAKPQPAEQQPTPDVPVEPVGWQYYQFGKWWNGDNLTREQQEDIKRDGHPIRYVYAAPQSTPDVSALVMALEELVNLMEDTRQGEYIPDSFTTQPARAVLATYYKGDNQ